jgi:hypothetical protein
VAGRQLRQLDTPIGQKRSGPDEEGVGPFAHKTCEGLINLLQSAGVENPDLHRHG